MVPISHGRCGIVCAVLAVAACSSTSTPTDAGPAGGPATGAPDTHCALPDGGHRSQETSAAACHPDAGPLPDDGGMDMAPDFGDAVFGTSALDDDCKYQLSYSVTPVRENTDVTFTVTITSATDGAPVTGARTSADVTLSDTHPAPNSGQHTVENPGGIYVIGPVHFDAAGRWTVRFHIFEQCSDLTEDSPHGHGAFLVDVP